MLYVIFPFDYPEMYCHVIKALECKIILSYSYFFLDMSSNIQAGWYFSLDNPVNVR